MGKITATKRKFVSRINNEGISDQNYKHAQRVWNTFDVKKLKYYVHLYDMEDVLTSLTLDIDFMKKLSPNFNLNSLNFVTFDSLLWECALKVTKIELELLRNVNMILDYENSITGRIKTAVFHYVEANNKY